MNSEVQVWSALSDCEKLYIKIVKYKEYLNKTTYL